MPATKEELFENPARGDYSAISYKLDWIDSSPPGDSSFLVDTVHGFIRAKPEAEASAERYTAALVAVDGEGNAVEVYHWSFTVVEKPEFRVEKLVRAIYIANVSLMLAAADEGEGSAGAPATHDVIERLSHASRTRRYTVGRTYQFTPVDRARSEFINAAAPAAPGTASTANANGVNQAITFTMKGAPHGFLVDPATGLMQGTTSSDMLGLHTISFEAVDGAGAFALAEVILFNISYEDTQVDANGPNGKGCGTGTKVDLDGDLFNGAFTCDCAHTHYGGANCKLELLVESSASRFNAPLFVGIFCGSAIVVLLVVVVAVKVRDKKKRMRPVNFGTVLQTMVADGTMPAALGETIVVPLEVKRKSVLVMDFLGKGAFGEVMKGMVQLKVARGRQASRFSASPSTSTLIAIKMCHLTTQDSSSGALAPEGSGSHGVEHAKNEMVREAVMMAQVGKHPNLVSLVGVVTSGEPIMLLLSYCDNGALLSLLQRKKYLNGYIQSGSVSVSVRNGYHLRGNSNSVKGDGVRVEMPGPPMEGLRSPHPETREAAMVRLATEVHVYACAATSRLPALRQWKHAH